MAITVAEQARGDCGGKIQRAFLLTADGTATTVDATTLDMHYIDSAVVSGTSIASAVTGGVGLATGAGKYIVLNSALNAADTLNLWVWGH